MRILKVRSYSKAGTKKTLVSAYNEKCFWVFNGPVLSNLRDLAHALTAMTDKQFAYHVDSKKNDFAAWVGQVLCDKECSAALLRSDTRRKAFAAVEKALNNYSV
jgi:hypothetical protein